MTLGKATSNQDALDRVKTRLVEDVGGLLQLCSSQGFFPLWLLSRSMFPIAESIAALLYGNSANDTAATLSRFIKDDLGAIDGRYIPLASVLCQVWRHGLTHHDEPPFLIVRPATQGPLTFDPDTRAVSWALSFNDPQGHMTFDTSLGTTLQFIFSLTTFFEHLVAVLDDPVKWGVFQGDEVMNRYNEWAIKILDHTRVNSETGKAATEILAIIP